MTKKIALRIILIISVAGLLFSGYLSYGELVQKACPVGLPAQAGGCSNVLGAPACVYGFIMYLIVFIVSAIGLKSEK